MVVVVVVVVLVVLMVVVLVVAAGVFCSSRRFWGLRDFVSPGFRKCMIAMFWGCLASFGWRVRVWAGWRGPLFLPGMSVRFNSEKPAQNTPVTALGGVLELRPAWQSNPKGSFQEPQCAVLICRGDVACHIIAGTCWHSVWRG